MSTPFVVLGAKLIESIALFETGTAALLNSESALIDKLIERDESYDVLLLSNSQVQLICCCLKDLEEAVVKIIENGTP